MEQGTSTRRGLLHPATRTPKRPAPSRARRPSQGSRQRPTGSSGQAGGQTAAPSTVLIRFGSPQTMSSAPAGPAPPGVLWRFLVGTTVERDDHHGTGGGPAQSGGGGVEHVVACVVLCPIGGFAEGQLMRGPRVLFARGEHQDVARCPPVSSRRSIASSAASSAPSAGAGINWICGWERFSDRAACGCPVEVCVRGVGAGRVEPGPGCPGRGEAMERGPGTGRGVGAVRPAAGVARGPWALS